MQFVEGILADEEAAVGVAVGKGAIDAAGIGVQTMVGVGGGSPTHATRSGNRLTSIKRRTLAVTDVIASIIAMPVC